MAKVSIVLQNKTDATIKFLLNLGVSPAIVDNVSEVRVDLEAGDITASALNVLTDNAVSIYDKTNNLKKEIPK